MSRKKLSKVYIYIFDNIFFIFYYNLGFLVRNMTLKCLQRNFLKSIYLIINDFF